MKLFTFRKLVLPALFAAAVVGTSLWSAAAVAAPQTKKAAPPTVDPDDDDPPVKKKRTLPPVDDDDEPPVRKKRTVKRGGLEALVRDTGLEYEKGDGEQPMFKLSVPARGRTVTVFALEVNIGTNKDGIPIVVGIIGMPVHSFSQGERPTSPLYKAVAELNDQIAVGRVSATRQGVLFTSSFILRSADTQMLTDHISIVIGTQVDVKKRLMPYLSDEESE